MSMSPQEKAHEVRMAKTQVTVGSLSYHEVRFPFDARRAAVWKAIANYLQRWVAADEDLLDLGAGYGDFSREIRAGQKWALEQNGALVKYWAESVTPLIQSAGDPWPLKSGSMGTILASNFFEHFTLEQGAEILDEAKHVLRPGGRLIVVQPNFRLE